MGSITNYDDICKCCGLDAMFNNYYYRTGEYDESCSVCGYYSSSYMQRKPNGGLVQDKIRVPMNNVRLRISYSNPKVSVLEHKLPEEITDEELQLIAWGRKIEQFLVLQKYGLVDVDNADSMSCYLGYYSKKNKNIFQHMAYIGNQIELEKSKHAQALVFYKAKFVETHRLSYGAIYVQFFGKRKVFFKCFRSKQNIAKWLKKWNRLTDTGYDDKHSYLMVIEDGKAKYLKGKFHYMYDTECDGENKGIANDSSAVFEEILSMN